MRAMKITASVLFTEQPKRAEDWKTERQVNIIISLHAIIAIENSFRDLIYMQWLDCLLPNRESCFEFIRF